MAKWPEQQVDRVRHDNDGVQMDSRCACGAGALARLGNNPSLSQTVCKDQITGPLRQEHSPAGAEGNE